MAEENKQILNTIQSAFREIPLYTVERFMEIPGSDAYLLTFTSQRGSLAQFIDSLVEPAQRHSLEKLGIEFFVDGAPKYNFRQYTSSARIGVLPSAWSFEDFATALQHDLSLIIDARRKLFRNLDPEVRGIEVLVHRFNLSENNYFEFKHEEGRKNAVMKIRELLSETLPVDQQLALLAYEGKVDILGALIAGLSPGLRAAGSN
jgi:hypothetical protein